MHHLANLHLRVITQLQETSLLLLDTIKVALAAATTTTIGQTAPSV